MKSQNTSSPGRILSRTEVELSQYLLVYNHLTQQRPLCTTQQQLSVTVNALAENVYLEHAAALRKAMSGRQVCCPAPRVTAVCKVKILAGWAFLFLYFKIDARKK